MRISDWSSDVCSSDLDQVARAERALMERDTPEAGRDWRQELTGFVAETDRVLDLLSGFMPEVRALDDAETLSYLHGTVSTRRHPVAVPETPLYLDAILVDTPLRGGIEPMLGERHLRTDRKSTRLNSNP